MRDPDLKGAAVPSVPPIVGQWKAWRLALPPVGQRGRPDADATIAGWLVYCPGAHAAWSWWWLTLMHLRPIEGVKPAVLEYPEATFEIGSIAQQPNVQPDPERGLETFAPLIPIDWMAQFHGVSDADAVRVLAAVVRAIMSGDVSPDYDFRSFWKRTIPATARCFAEGGHPSS